MEGSESPGAEAALRLFTLGAAMRSSPSEGFLGSSTAGAAVFADGDAFAVREAGAIGVEVKFELREIPAALVSGCANPEFTAREAGAPGAGCRTGVDVKFEL